MDKPIYGRMKIDERIFYNPNNLKLNIMQVKTVKIKNINDKDQLYVVIEEGSQKAIINVGQKTFDAVSKIVNNPKKEGGK